MYYMEFVDIKEAKNIEVNTVKQSESTLWYQERSVYHLIFLHTNQKQM